jgi:hypothetical protein
MTSLTGGQQDLQEYQNLVWTMQQNGFNVEVQCNLARREAVADYRDNNLVNACLLQFPYGRCKMHEDRLKANGSFTNSTDVGEYVEHLSRISQPHFQQPFFSLILYNMTMKQMMVCSAGWRVRNKVNAETLEVNLMTEELDNAVNDRRNRSNPESSSNGNWYLRAVDASKKAVPHMNLAAKRAKQNAEAIQH